MTTTARPLGLGDFDSARSRRPSDNVSPPQSARLPPLQIQTSSQWSSKNIWGFSGAGGNGFGAVGRPKGAGYTSAEEKATYTDTKLDSSDDRKSPSLLSPVGPSPWAKPYGLPSPIEPSTGDFGAKRLPDVHSKNSISPTFQSMKQLPQKTLPSIGSLSLRTSGLNGDSRPSETSSARPAFNRLGSLATSPAEPFESGRHHSNSLSSWDTHPAEHASRPAHSVVQSAAAEYAPYTDRFGYMPAKAADTVTDLSVWSSARQPPAASHNVQQGVVKHSLSARAPLYYDSQNDAERGFDMAQSGQQAPAPTQRSSERDAYTLRTQNSSHHDVASLPQAAWDVEYIPRSFVPASTSTRQLDSHASAQAFPDFQYNSDPHRRNTDLTQYRLSSLADEYALRQAAAGIDPRLRPGLLQFDRKTMLSLQEQDDIMQSFMHAHHLRNQYLASLPYSFPGAGHPGAPQYMQAMPMPSMAPANRGGDNHQALRSQLLDEFLVSQKTNLRRFELRDIYDHIVEFSGNQHGSKFIQNKLETATSDEKERVFRELMPNAIQLMKDIYGNYVIQKVIERGDQSQKTALFNVMSGKVYELSCQVYGCRVVQTALQHVLVHQQASMVDELKNHVLDCVRDQNGNHVIQIVVKHVPAEYTHFVVDAFIGNIKHLATHPYGCRVVQRLLDHCVEPSRSQILRELHACANDLVSDQYGNYVTQHVLEHGCPEDRAKIIGLVRQHLIPYSKQKFASNVVEKCLNYGNEEQRREIMLELSAKAPGCESALPLLIRDSFCNYVIQRLLDTLSPRDYAHFVEILTPEVAALRRIAPNNKQVDNVAKKMYRHDPYSNQHYHNPALQAMRIDTASSTPALTHDESSPYSTSQPSVADENTSLHAKDPRMADIRIEVTGH